MANFSPYVVDACNVPYHLVSAATTNATSVTSKTGYAKVVQAINNGTGWAYVKIFDKATAPTVGTDTPILTLGLPPGGGTLSGDFYVSKGVALAITGAAADNDTTAVSAAQVVVNILYSV